ncbi:MAG: MgtC/SapB family protein [Anaerolineae bacterium]|nr:MgtC/SapB family protein [Anaerolineae bacterium]
MSLELQLEVSLRLVIAVILSALVGYDREQHDHPAGLRTHILVGLGSALFTGLSVFAFEKGDPGRVASQIVVGIGFLGAGSIIQLRERRDIRGLTTAAGLWAVAAVGMACGSGNYLLAAVATILIWFTLAIVKRMQGNGQNKRNGETPDQTEEPIAPPDKIKPMYRDRKSG